MTIFSAPLSEPRYILPCVGERDLLEIDLGAALNDHARRERDHHRGHDQRDRPHLGDHRTALPARLGAGVMSEALYQTWLRPVGERSARHRTRPRAVRNAEYARSNRG